MSFRLAHKLFEHPKVLEMMRLHSKTFAKMNVAILAILILAGFCAVLNMSNIEYAYRYTESIVNKTDVNPCQTVEVHSIEKIISMTLYEVKVSFL